MESVSGNLSSEYVSSWELIRRCAGEPDPDAWDAFVDRFGARLAAGVRSAFRRAGSRYSPEELDDLVQEVYCRLLRRGRAALHACEGQDEPSVDAYLFRLAQRVAIDHLRSCRAARRGGGIRALELGGAVAPESIASREPSPEQRALLAEGRRLLAARVREVPDADGLDWRVLVWSLVEGLTSREIASRLNGRLGPSGVDSRLYRLRRRLAEVGVLVPPRPAQRGTLNAVR